MESVLKMIMLSVSTIITAFAISAVIYVQRVGTFTYNDFASRVNSLLAGANDVEFVNYRGQYVDGKTVRAIMEEYGGEYLIRVKTRTNPLGFAVVSKPFKNKILVKFTDGGEYADYTSSSSFYYVRSSSQFMTTLIRDEWDEVVGVTFSERGAGKITQEVMDAYNDGKECTLADAQAKYYQELYDDVMSLSSADLSASLTELKSNINDAKEETDSVKQQGYAGVDVSVNEEYNLAKAAAANAAAEADEAWSDLVKAYEEDTGKLALGHVTISEDSSTNLDNSSNLQYWVNLFNGG